MRFVIVTGMSGAGKSTALKMLEDAEYFCVDNLPIPLVEKFAQLTADGTSGEIQKVAVGIDIRSGQALPDLQSVLEWMSINGICYEILFLDASDEVLIKRYKETRRSHPLAGKERLDRGIAKERLKLDFLKKRADYILDTSTLLTRELKAELERIFMGQKHSQRRTCHQRQYNGTDANGPGQIPGQCRPLGNVKERLFGLVLMHGSRPPPSHAWSSGYPAPPWWRTDRPQCR